MPYTPTNVNEMGINQISEVLNTVVEMATGRTDLKATDESSFVSVAQTALLQGYDPILNAISQVLSKTIFSIRPYSQRFRSLNVDNEMYGNHVRKLQVLDPKFEDDARLTLTDGESVDMYKVSKPQVVQTNWYGANQYELPRTIFKDQLDTAFSSSAEFQKFLSMVMQNASDLITQAKENESRFTLNNLIGATLTAGKTTQYVDVLAQYNDFAGTSLNPDTVFAPENFPNFVRWLYSFVQILSDRLEERSIIYHNAIAGNEISRHTPRANQKLFLYNPIVRYMESIVTSTTFHDEKTVFPPYEGVNYWQAFNDPMLINVTPAILDNGGKATTGTNVSAYILGVIMDEESAGITTVNEWSAATPFNAKGAYTNIFYHFTTRFWNDFSENCVILTLGEPITTSRAKTNSAKSESK